MAVLKIISLIALVVIGIPNTLIDHKHRKRKAYGHGNAWAYYSELAKAGSWEGKFMMWSGYVCIWLVILTIGFGFYELSR